MTEQLKKPVRSFEETFSAEEVVMKEFFPNDDEWLEELLLRQDFIARNIPYCPACSGLDKGGCKQVQILDHEAPAKWRCRLCKYKFEYEPRKT